MSLAKIKEIIDKQPDLIGNLYFMYNDKGKVLGHCVIGACLNELGLSIEKDHPVNEQGIGATELEDYLQKLKREFGGSRRFWIYLQMKNDHIKTEGRKEQILEYLDTEEAKLQYNKRSTDA